MPAYFVVLGSTPKLSFAELSAVVSTPQPKLVKPRLAALSLSSDKDARELLDKIAGSVKVLRQLEVLKEATKESLVASLITILSNTEGKQIFSLSYKDVDWSLKIDNHELKKQLSSKGIQSRYLESKDADLSAAVLLHQPKVKELIIIQDSEKLIITQTVAVQDINDWTKRDRRKPYFDRKKGMLPPKLARMMINLALASTSTPAIPVLYDPFCGTGTVLMESALMGLTSIGSDLDKNSVKGTKHNLEWLQRHYPEVKNHSHTFVHDVTAKYPESMLNSIDCIVTEPFLGRPQPKEVQFDGMLKGLSKLYLGAFKKWRSILKNDASIVIIFPQVQTKSGKVKNLSRLIDKLAQLGYTTSSQPWLYHRPTAVTQRQIYTFKYVKS